MEQGTYEKVKKSYFTIRHILNIPVSKRTPAEEAELVKERQFFNKHVQNFYKLLTKKDFDMIQVADFNEIEEYRNAYNILRVAETPNKLDAAIDVLGLQKRVADIDDKHSSVQGLLETLDPLLTKWSSILDRAKIIAKGLSFAPNEWEAEAFYEMLIPDSILAKYRELQQLVEECRIRSMSYKDRYEKLSRFVTISQLDPQEMNREIGPNNGGEAYRSYDTKHNTTPPTLLKKDKLWGSKKKKK